MESDTTSDLREARGRQLARTKSIERVGPHWLVPSQTESSAKYTVDIEASACTCLDYELRKCTCKHQHAVLFWIAWGYDVIPPTDEGGPGKPKRPTYSQGDWAAYNASQTHEREYVWRFGRALCNGLVDPPREPGPGRKPVPVGDAAFATILKIYATRSNRFITPDLVAAAQRGFLARQYHYNVVSKFLTDEASTPVLLSLIDESAAPIRSISGRYAIDSTGMSTGVYNCWFRTKHNPAKPQEPADAEQEAQTTRRWVKIHAVVDTDTHAIVGVKVSWEGDSPVLRELVEHVRQRHDVKEVCADKAYSAVANYEYLDSWSIEPYIPFKDNAVPNSRSISWTRHLCDFELNRAQFLTTYHQRSNVEATFSALKRKFRASLASKNHTAQVNEVLAKILVYNLCCLTKGVFMAGLAPVFWSDVPNGSGPIVKPE